MTGRVRAIRFVSWFGIGAGLGAGLWSFLVTMIEPPDTWLRVYVSSECRITERVIADAEQAGPGLGVIVLPIDEPSANVVCPRAIAELSAERPLLALLPDAWTCSTLLRRSSLRYQSIVGAHQGMTPMYEFEGETGMGWSPVISESVVRGDANSVRALLLGQD